MARFRTLYGRGLALLAGLVGSFSGMAADPGVGEWTTFGNGPRHSGYYPRTIGTGTFTASWTKPFTTRVNHVAVSGDTIYATTDGYHVAGMRAFALKVEDGSERWNFPLADASSVNPPTYAVGRVYFQRCNHTGDTHLWSLDAASGVLRFAAPHTAQWNDYAAPTIVDGGAFVNGGTYGGIYGFDATTGAERFFNRDLPQQDGWTPSYADGVVYSCVNGIFTAHDPQTGSEIWTRDLKTTTTGTTTWTEGNILAISDGKAAVVGGGRIVVIDLATRTQLWSKSGAYKGTPAFAEGRVYAIVGSQVVAYNALNGSQVATYSGGTTPINQPLVTEDSLIYASVNRTYIFDRATASLRQQLSVGGFLSYASGRLYVVSDFGSLSSILATFTITPPELDPPAEPLPPPQLPEARPNPKRTLAPTTAGWIDTVQTGGIAYFLFDSPAKIERYELATSSWLEPISLPSGPTALTVSPAAIYVALGNSVSKFSLDGSMETPLSATPFGIQSLFELDGRLYLVSSSGLNFMSIDPVSGIFLAAKNYSPRRSGITLAGSNRKFFGRSTHVGPSDIVSVSLNADGSFGEWSDSPYHGDYPDATRTFLFPGETRVVDDSGIIYSTGDLSYLGSFGGAFDDIAFAGEKTVLLRGNNTFIVYSAGLAEIGRKTIAGSHLRIYADQQHVFSFAREDGRGVVVTKTAFADIVPEEPPPGIDPDFLTYTPDAIEFGTDTVFLLSRLHQSVFRWSISQQRYLPTIELTDIPQRIAYSATHNRLYLSYSTGRVGKVELAGDGVTESEFVILAKAASVMAAAGEFMFFAHPRGLSRHSLSTYNADGVLVGSIAEFEEIDAAVWNPAVSRMLNTSYSRLSSIDIDPEGRFGLVRYAPHVDNAFSRAPFSVSPDGAGAVFSNAAVHNALDLSRTGDLPVPAPPSVSARRIIDAAWLGGGMHTIRGIYSLGSNTPEQGVIESWNQNLEQQGRGFLLGSPLRLGALADGLLSVSIYEGRPIFTRFNAALEQVSSEPGDQPSYTGPVTRENPSRNLGQTTTKWLDMARHNGVTYFLFNTPAKIERYDTVAGVWLNPIPLPDGPRWLAVGASGIYVSFGKNLSKFSFDGTTETLLFSGAVDFRVLAEHDGRIYVTAIGVPMGSRYGVAELATGMMISQGTFSYATSQLAFAPARGKFFGRTSSIFPPDIMQITLKADGTFGTESHSPYSSGLPSATRTFVFPGETRVVDDSGVVYSTADLTYLGSLAGAFTDLDFAGDGPIVLRASNTLVAYSEALHETGRATIAANQERISVGGDFVYSFARENGRGVRVTRTALSKIAPPELPAGIDPTFLTYTPDQIEFGSDTVFLLSKLHQSVFRWSISGGRYLPPISLTEAAQRISYSAAHNRLYLSYATGRVSKVDLANGTAESGFANFVSAPTWMMAAGDYMFFATGTEMRYTYRADGTIAGFNTDNLRYSMAGAAWSGALSKIYYASGTAPRDFCSLEIGADGRFGRQFSGGFSDNRNILGPVRIAPDGSRAVFADAAVYNPVNFSYVGTLAIQDPRIRDSTWLDGVLHTVRNTSSVGSSQPAGVVESWNSEFTIKDSGVVAGAPVGLNAVTGGVLVVSLLESRPVFTLYSAELEQVSSGPLDNTPPIGPFTRDNPSRPLEDTDGPWIEAAKHGGIAYFLFASPAKIERYDLEAGQWLQPISLPPGPRSLAVGLNGIYVSFGRLVSRFSFDGTEETILYTATIDVRPLAEHNSLLYILGSTQATRFGVVDLTTGTLRSERVFSYGLTEVSFAPGSGKFYGRSFGINPSDIFQVTLNADGTFDRQTDSPHHGSFPNATRTFVFPDETQVVDDAGTIYATSSLNYVGRLGSSFTDLDFASERPIVLRPGELVAYSPTTLVESGRKTLPAGVLRIFASENMITAFSAAAGRGVSAISAPIDEIQPPEPIEPTGLDYTPDTIEMGEDGVIYLLVRQYQSVFRWSVQEGRYLPTIRLPETPSRMTYSKALNRLYFTYPTGRVSKIDSAHSLDEATFATLQEIPTGLQTAGEYLFAVGATGKNRHSTFSSGGVLINSMQMSYGTNGYTWSEANRRMYFLRDNGLPSDLAWQSIDAQGQITGFGNRSSSSPRYPIRLSPDGSIILLGNGDLYDALTLDRLGTLAFPAATAVVRNAGSASGGVLDAVWLGNAAFTLKAGAEGTAGPVALLHRWDADYEVNGALELNGSPLRLFPSGDQLVAIVMKGERPDFLLITPELDMMEVSPPAVELHRVTGTYFANLSIESGTGGPMGGMLKLTVNPAGKTTGVLNLAGKTYRFRTRFDEFGHALVSLLHKGKVWTLALDLSEGLPYVRLRGSLSSDEWVLSINGSRTRAGVQADRQLFLLSDYSPVIRDEMPPVLGHGVMTISRKGHVRISGTLLVGGKVWQGTRILEDGAVVLNLVGKRKDSFVTGKVAPADTERSVWRGRLAWQKNATERAVPYANQIEAPVAFSSSRYLKGDQPLNLPADRQVTLELYGGDLSMSSVNNGILQKNGKVTSEFDRKKVLARINVKTGLVSGSFMHPGSGKKVQFSGVVNRSLNQVFGGFLGPKHGGVIQIAPGETEFSGLDGSGVFEQGVERVSPRVGLAGG